MSLVISGPSDAELIRRAMAQAERNPNQVMNGNLMRWNGKLKQNEWQPEFFTIGREATLDDAALGLPAIRCKVFLALGKVEVTTMKIFAKYIFFLNDFKVKESLELNGAEASAFIGNQVNIQGDLASGGKQVLSLGVQLCAVSRFQDSIEFESPVDAGIRLLKKACCGTEEEKSRAS